MWCVWSVSVLCSIGRYVFVCLKSIVFKKGAVTVCHHNSYDDSSRFNWIQSRLLGLVLGMPGSISLNCDGLNFLDRILTTWIWVMYIDFYLSTTWIFASELMNIETSQYCWALFSTMHESSKLATLSSCGRFSNHPIGCVQWPLLGISSCTISKNTISTIFFSIFQCVTTWTAIF